MSQRKAGTFASACFEHLPNPFAETVCNRVWIARQPDQSGQRLREADDVLPGTGSNFEHDALLPQNPSKHLSDWPTIACSRRGELSRVVGAAANLDRVRALLRHRRSPGVQRNFVPILLVQIRKPSGFCGIFNVSKSDLAFTFTVKTGFTAVKPTPYRWSFAASPPIASRAWAALNLPRSMSLAATRSMALPTVGSRKIA